MKNSENKKEEPKKDTKKNSLVNNINAKKKAGTSKSKSESTVSDENFQDMKTNWEENRQLEILIPAIIRYQKTKFELLPVFLRNYVFIDVDIVA